MIYDITLTVVDSSTSTTHAGAAVSIEVVQVVGQVNTGGGGGITDGDKGDITVSDSGETLTINDGAVTAAKLENSGVSAASYGSASAIPVITVDEKGRITSATTQAPASGGSRRILAATLTYTGAPSSATNQITATVTGTLPDPATVLPGGTLQSVEYVAQSLVDYNVSLSFISTGAANEARVPFTFSFICGGAGNFQSFVQQSISIPSSGDTVGVSVTNRVMNSNTVYDAALISTWGFTPVVTMRVGEPNYAFTNGFGSVSQNIVYNSLQLDGTIKVYYLFA